MTPITSIASRYANKIVSNKYYGTLSFSGSTLPIPSGSTLIGHKGTGTTPGYIYLPYIMVDNLEEYKKERLRAERKEKLKKLDGLKCD